MQVEKTTAKKEIVKRLKTAESPLAVHEFGIIGYSENCLATRLSELAKAGVVCGRRRAGKAFNEWYLNPTVPERADLVLGSKPSLPPLCPNDMLGAGDQFGGEDFPAPAAA